MLLEKCPSANHIVLPVIMSGFYPTVKVTGSVSPTHYRQAQAHVLLHSGVDDAKRLQRTCILALVLSLGKKVMPCIPIVRCKGPTYPKYDLPTRSYGCRHPDGFAYNYTCLGPKRPN